MNGKKALITGAARRVGRAITLDLARAGFDVAVHFHSSRRDAESLVREVRGMGRGAELISGDLGDEECWAPIVQQAAEALGGLDVLVNNASILTDAASDSVHHFDAQTWEQTFRINVTAPMALAHHARKHLEASGHGRIINLCDVAAERPWPDRAAYCASKAALVALTRSLARALAPRITVNGVAPGIAVFPESYDSDLRQRLTSRVPLGREGTPEEVARLVRFLVEEGGYITGQVMTIDGGRILE